MAEYSSNVSIARSQAHKFINSGSILKGKKDCRDSMGMVRISPCAAFWNSIESEMHDECHIGKGYPFGKAHNSWVSKQGWRCHEFKCSVAPVTFRITSIDWAGNFKWHRLPLSLPHEAVHREWIPRWYRLTIGASFHTWSKRTANMLLSRVHGSMIFL